MKTFNSINSLENHLKKLKRQNKTIGLVPTMGALHKGHLSLIKKCRRENDITVLSIFVNPTQFGPKEDFKNYPRQKKNDDLLAKKENVDIIFYPSIKKMYPTGFLTYVEVEKITKHLCGQYRKNHFKGVTTVVSKLLNIIQPHTMYLGKKDIQQAFVLKRMVKDLNISTQIRLVATVREKNGLALSSRNQYLTQTQYDQATILYKALKTAKNKAQNSRIKAKDAENLIRNMINRNSSARIQYVSCVDGNTLLPVKRLEGKIIIALAAYFGKTRLIDNIIFTVK